MTSKALYGGAKAVQTPGSIFVADCTKEDEEAVLEVLRRGAMSGTDVTKQYEQEFAAWQGSRYALGCNTGTAALFCAFFGCKVGVGDEVICPSLTYWASALPLFAMGATPVFAEVDPNTLCLDPKDIEHRITERTKAIVVVHYSAYPAGHGPGLWRSLSGTISRSSRMYHTLKAACTKAGNWATSEMLEPCL